MTFVDDEKCHPKIDHTDEVILCIFQNIANELNGGKTVDHIYHTYANDQRKPNQSILKDKSFRLTQNTRVHIANIDSMFPGSKVFVDLESDAFDQFIASPQMTSGYFISI